MLDRFVGEPLRAAEPVALPNGMFLHDFIAGDGQEVKADSKVRVNYRLFLLDTTKIHDTWETKRDETFLVSQAPLKGMAEGMVGMRVGGKRKIAMPYGLAFGEAGNEISPRKAMVVCDVFIEDHLRLSKQRRFDGYNRLIAELNKFSLHPLDRPEQIDRGRSGRSKVVANRKNGGFKVVQ